MFENLTLEENVALQLMFQRQGARYYNLAREINRVSNFFPVNSEDRLKLLREASNLENHDYDLIGLEHDLSI